MGDMGDVFNALREHNKQKRSSNTESSTKILKEKRIAFTSFNNGVMLRVGDFDFFPSTGLFINKTTKEKSRGVFNLIKKIQNSKNGGNVL